MELKTTKEIQKIVLKEDVNSILRCPNIRRFVKDNNIEYSVGEGIWLINIEDLLRKINPSGIKEHKKQPRMRSIKSSVDQWNADHKIQKIDKHIVEHCMASDSVFKVQHIRTWVINYDQLQAEIRAYFKAKKAAKVGNKKIITRKSRKSTYCGGKRKNHNMLWFFWCS